ncbi:hypothetical protein [Rathayibacter sp. VKM Ac-2754]|uniref:hypothetical protein n=1 Tax=Rathayibacter sp. VKM Ac-2754 TaxID=2609251 RepID=UPI00135B7E74|nr:hypothetical protein [Rathayibacter sp. VKM Ac-2754]MWV58725.1 hypothetical protein [Rathayibacter sp. VKM Ac-2754]
MSTTNAHHGWQVGETPWVRSALVGPAANSPGYAQCYFCGQMTAKLSESDVEADTGRVDVYCNNTWCEARETTVLILRDGAAASDRADTRMPAAIDNDLHSTQQKPFKVLSLGELLEDEPAEAEIVARRTDDGPADYAAPGRPTE